MQRRPNVLFLLSDQHNSSIAGFAGDRIVRTQNLDRLAAQSAQFSNAYCQFPLCTPSRISMWTGRLPSVTGAMCNYAPIPPVALTLPEHFAGHGYTTCGIGKMHVGGDQPTNCFQFRPYGDIVPNRFCGHQPDPPSSARDQAWTAHHIGHFPFAGPSEIPDEMLQESIVTRETLEFVRDRAEAPWFVCASYGRPHHPLTAPRRYFDHYWSQGPNLQSLPDGFPHSLHPHDRFIVDDFRLTDFTEEQRRRGLAAYYASVDFLDDCIGDLLEGLRLDGLLENTIIIYTSDHGDLASEHGLWWKRSYYDGSSAVPLLVRVPGAKHLNVSNVVELLDVFPTLCDLCGLPVPDGLDGESLVPLMHSGERRKDYARCDHIARKETSFRMVRTPQWKYVEFPEYPPLLFDTERDPSEERSLADLAQNASIVSELHSRLWTDGETWKGLFAARESCREGALAHRSTRDHTPNQYALPDGSLVDAETDLYRGYLND